MTLLTNAFPKIKEPENSPFVAFEKGSKERAALELEIEKIRKSKPEVLPLWIGGPVKTSAKAICVAPHDFKRVLAEYCVCSEKDAHNAIKTVLDARKAWSQIPLEARLGIFQKAARLLETKYLFKMVAAVMEDYSKNPYEAFIDVQELVDFWNFNCYYASTIYQEQPRSNNDTSNMLDYRPLEGFVYALPPNNFIAIEGNLPTAPLIMGNVVIVKPSSDVVYSFHLVLKILLEAGLPKNVLAVLHGDSKMISDIILDHPMLSGVHFTGGTETFKEIRWKIAQNEYKDLYKNFVRIVGETGGKDFIVVFDDHDPVETAATMVIGGFGYQGRKCSATSRVYMTCEMWEKVRPELSKFMKLIKVGDVADFSNYMNAMINEKEFRKSEAYIERAWADSEKSDEGAVCVFYSGRNYSSKGWFIYPTIIVTKDPHYVTMREEIFGPVITVCVLPQKNYKARVLKLCDETSPYALTGAIHTNDALTFCEALQELRYAAGNIYNAKTTGAMVGAQPFSGSRKSGTNSKVGWRLNLYQWADPRTISITKVKPTDFAPPYLDRE